MIFNLCSLSKLTNNIDDTDDHNDHDDTDDHNDTDDDNDDDDEYDDGYDNRHLSLKIHY